MKALMLATLLASTLTLAAENLVSGWSPASNNVSFRILCPEALTAGGTDRLFWVKCEARNEGTADIWLTNRARLFLTDSNGQVQRCLRRSVMQQDGQEISYVRKLSAGETCSWWENGECKEAGRYGLHAVLDESGVGTPPLQVTIAQFNEGEGDYRLKLALEAAFETFPVAQPNEGEAQGTYHWMAFRDAASSNE